MGSKNSPVAAIARRLKAILLIESYATHPNRPNATIVLVLSKVREWTSFLHPHEINEKMREYSRVTGKDILKYLRKKLILDHGQYHQDPRSTDEPLVVKYPDLRNVCRSLWKLYSHPITDSVNLHTVDKVKGHRAIQPSRWN